MVKLCFSAEERERVVPLDVVFLRLSCLGGIVAREVAEGHATVNYENIYVYNKNFFGKTAVKNFLKFTVGTEERKKFFYYINFPTQLYLFFFFYLKLCMLFIKIDVNLENTSQRQNYLEKNILPLPF